MTECFHCGQPVPDGLVLTVPIDGEARRMCCHGCHAVAQAIVDSGNVGYYRFRTEHAPTGKELVPEFLKQIEAYDLAPVQERFVEQGEGDQREVTLILEGITCAACIWLNEQYLQGLPGILSAQINYATHRARIRWDTERIKLSEIIEAVSRIGYLAHPYDPQQQQQVLEAEKKDFIRRIGVAGLLMMQVMTIALALYTGAWWGMEPEFERFFEWTAFGLTLPVLFYSAAPFYKAAWVDLKQRRVGMDVPVSLAMTLAMAASVYATWSGEGEVYYDSVVMFTFLLLVTRFLEMLARKRAAQAAESVLAMQPTTANRIYADGSEGVVAVAELVVGDRLRLRPGEVVPIDSIIVEGRGAFDESLLSGESLPVAHGRGEEVIGGSLNIEGALILEVSKTGGDTVLASVFDLIDRGQAEKPRIARLADRVAAVFVPLILAIAAVVGIYWYDAGSAFWLATTVAVLVVSCPCALSLATPAALAAVSGRLMNLNVISGSGGALEIAAKLDRVVFDKTGTLTEGRLDLVDVVGPDGSALAESDAIAMLKMAASLEQASEHPLAKAVLRAAGDASRYAISQVAVEPGRGLAARVNGELWRIGRAEFVSPGGVPASRAETVDQHADVEICLGREHRIEARLRFQDELRPGAMALVSALRARGVKLAVVSGDRQVTADAVARRLDIDDAFGDQMPDDKLRRIREWQSRGEVVAMIGDGINDAPVLAAADLSIAMGGGAQLAAKSADMVLVSDRLEKLVDTFWLARRTVSVIRQNLAWALGYNLLAIPVAAAGLIAPWMAAIGMSLSSLIVVLNALRLARAKSS